MKKLIVLCLLLLSVVFFVQFTSKGKQVTNQIKSTINNSVFLANHIDKKGNTIASRVLLPKGYKRVKYPDNSFETYLRNYPLKEHGSKIINYDGSEYFAQNWHDAILEVPVPKNGLQQCADALMRIRAEYLWEQNRKNEIGF